MMLPTIVQQWFRGREIFIPGARVIMRRFIVFDSEHLGMYVHHICSRDHESLHNHPWKWSAGAWTLYIHGARAQRDGFLTRAVAGWSYRDASESSFEATRPIRPR